MKPRLHPYLIILCFFGGVILSSCTKTKADDKGYLESNVNTLSSLVNPFIGTGGHGHTYPGPSLPNGMVQLSPDTRLTGWDACSGYHISDDSILGFSHTHLSGTGIGDYGDILIAPYSTIPSFIPNSNGNSSHNYALKKKPNSEFAIPGYYKVELGSEIKAELTATTRAGFHRYSFSGDKAGIILDLNHTLQKHAQIENRIEIVGNNEIRGVKKTRGWAREHQVYFHAICSMPFEYELIGDSSIARLIFPDNTDEILVKVGISYVSEEGAKKNLDKEIIDWGFDKYRNQALDIWEDYFSKIEIDGGSHSDRKIFYTSFYHAGLAPNTFSDIDGRYLGMDGEVRLSDRTIYTVFSLWDTFRALHPFNTIVRPKINQEMMHSLLTKYMEGGVLPKWELAGNYTGTMIGYHAVSVLVDSYVKGQTDFNIDLAYEAIVHASKYDTISIDFFDQNIQNRLMPMGKFYNSTKAYIPADLENESVSKALEYAYNDWSIAQMAKELGYLDDYSYYMARSKKYKEYFDQETGFMRGKLANGKWKEPFDPKYSEHRKDDYVEGNAWQWSWFVPHDIKGLVDLHGGEEAFSNKLDQLFSESSEIKGNHSSADISGLIGQYAHGNEPSHHIAYLYNYVGKPEKTQKIVHEILRTQYQDDFDGLSGNEDCGQMSAWYLMSAMGFYQVSPGDPTYALGAPLFDKVTIHQENGNKFIIETENNKAETYQIASFEYNGEPLKSPFMTHSQIEKGGILKVKKR